ncbi:MAG: hypothetical protein FOGNACKC_02782 [Anaerolineae bacterium]|nr:hypothetical protein [Anaerolineae bacterium]
MKTHFSRVTAPLWLAAFLSLAALLPLARLEPAAAAASAVAAQPAITPTIGTLTATNSVTWLPILLKSSLFPTAPLPLSSYPRPANDNGLGIHWSTHLYAQSDAATSYFVSELAQMNIKWVKLLVDGLNNRDYDDTIDALVARDIMPVIRIYRQCNTPYNPTDLDRMVRHYVKKGVFYFETYNEPNQSGKSGGWCDGDGTPQPEVLAQIWADAARVIYLAGGYPSLPSFFAPDQKLPDWQTAFFYRFFNALRQQGNEDVLYFSWGAIHNYTINHPPTYPFDPVNQFGPPLTAAEISRYNLTPTQAADMNLRREIAAILKYRPVTAADAARLGFPPELVGEINLGFTRGKMNGFLLRDDSTAFLHFISYREQFYRLFGFDIPLISTEGGATRESAEDVRYPKVDGQTVADWTLWSANYMLESAPDYYFASNTWLLAQHALDYDEPVWEKNAWYHNRSGDQEPVVNALKNRPRKAEARQLCFETELRAAAPHGKKSSAKCRVAPPQPTANPLANYPRPPADNGRGLHWSPGNQPQPPEITDYFVNQLLAMNIKWVKFLQDDSPTVADPYLLEQLAAHGIEPILRVYQPANARYRHLPELVPAAAAKGVHYFELFNEPNLAGPAGGWAAGESPDVGKMVELWLVAAQEVQAGGGYPSLPPLAAGGAIDDMLFLREFLDGVRARGQAGLLPGSWLPLHNYFLNHPFDYPTDPVNVDDIPLSAAEIAARGLTPAQAAAINTARQNAKLPFEQGGFWVGNTIDEDSNAFAKFEAYARIFSDRFGYTLPILGTEGGAIIGAAEDPRYPPVTEADHTRLTLQAYHFMLDAAPDYFFVQTPWLIANNAIGSNDPRFETAAWFKDRAGNALPVIEALKTDPRKSEVR